MDISLVEDLAKLLRDNDISEITVEEGGSRIRLRKGAPVQAAAPALALEAPTQVASTLGSPAPEPKPAELPRYITSPIVGLFHTARPAVKLGDKVRIGQVVGTVEALKLMNDIVADDKGTVVEVFADEGTPVEYGFRLFRIANSVDETSELTPE